MILRVFKKEKGISCIQILLKINNYITRKNCMLIAFSICQLAFCLGVLSPNVSIPGKNQYYQIPFMFLQKTTENKAETTEQYHTGNISLSKTNYIFWINDIKLI